MDWSKINNPELFSVVLSEILDVAHYQEVVGPNTLLEDIGIYKPDCESLAEALVAAVPLFTDIRSNSYNSWKTVYDVYRTVARLDREGCDNPSVKHNHHKKDDL